MSNLSHIAYSYMDEKQYIELCKFLYKEQRRKTMNYIYERMQHDGSGREPESELLTRTEYRDFLNYVDKNYDEFYGCKVGYSVTKVGENFEVKLTSNEFITLKDILLDIRK